MGIFGLGTILQYEFSVNGIIHSTPESPPGRKIVEGILTLNCFLLSNLRVYTF